MSQPTTSAQVPQGQSDESTNTKVGIPEGAAKEESHGVCGGNDRLKSETVAIHPDAGKEQARDI